ncbi:MAG: hypothetical protein Q9161_007454 [Pseudevernia consocians]
MAKGSTLHALLEAENEPSEKSYNEAVSDTIGNPKQISGLAEESVRDDFLILLTTRSHRLAHFFRRLRSEVRPVPKSSTTSNIAAETIHLLVHALPDLHRLLETTKVLDFLLPALDICFASSQRPTLRELASVLASSGTLLEHLVNDHLGVEIIRQWISMQNRVAVDSGTLELWTEKLVTMVHSCAIDHDVAYEIQQWHELKALKNSLRNLEQSTSKSLNKPSTPATRHDLPVLGSMKQLSREDKKARVARRHHQDTNSTIPALQDDDKRSLKIFDIHVPGSKSSLLEVIERLENEKTTAILLSVASNFPCYPCISGTGSLSQDSKGGTRDESFQAVSTPHIEILDKGLGVWKPWSDLFLMTAALVWLIDEIGLAGPVTEKLNEIASGCWNPQSQSLAGSKSQRKCLKVPIARTSFGQNQSILWQIAIGTDEETELPQQEIKVDKDQLCLGRADIVKISKVLDRVISLHKSYSDEIVRRCRQHDSAVDGTQIPARFEDPSLHPNTWVRPSADLDVRTVDQDIIEMSSRSICTPACLWQN